MKSTSAIHPRSSPSCRISRRNTTTFRNPPSATLPAKLGISDAKIYGVATFYENFSLEPKGKYVIKVCDGTACHVRKSVPILEEIRKQLNVTEKKPTTDDMLFTVETVSCLGACGLAPVCTVNDHVYPAMTPEKAREMIREIRRKEGLDA